MYEKNKQYAVHLDARRELDQLLSKSLLDAQLGASETGLTILNYVRLLVPRLRYKVSGDGELFFY